MIRTNAILQTMRGRLKHWVVAAFVVAMAGWIFEFSTHIHLPNDHGDEAPGIVHVCALCAAVATGAPPPAHVIAFVPASSQRAEPSIAVSFVPASAPAVYRSRGPPTA